jgi:hypothetical protein
LFPEEAALLLGLVEDLRVRGLVLVFKLFAGAAEPIGLIAEGSSFFSSDFASLGGS